MLTQNAAGRVGYKNVTEQLIAEIAAGAHVVGAPLPTEGDLARALDTSRGTIRQAMAELERMGYISRRQGARTLLVSDRPSERFRHDTFSAEQFISFGDTTRVQLLAAEDIDPGPELTRLLAFPDGQRLTRLQSLRRDRNGTRVMCYSETFIPTEFGDVAPRLEAAGAVFTLLEQQHGLVIRRIRRAISAIRLDSNLANRLGQPEGNAALRMMTRFFDLSDRQVEVSFAHFPEGIDTLEQEFRRNC